MRSFFNKNMVSFTLGQEFSTWGSRTPRGRAVSAALHTPQLGGHAVTRGPKFDPVTI